MRLAHKLDRFNRVAAGKQLFRFDFPRWTRDGRLRLTTSRTHFRLVAHRGFAAPTPYEFRHDSDLRSGRDLALPCRITEWRLTGADRDAMMTQPGAQERSGWHPVQRQVMRRWSRLEL